MRNRALLFLIGLCASAGASAQVVTGDVTAVGFRTGGGGGLGSPFIYRAGQWTPIQVQLSVQGGGPFQGQLRVEARDLDGDSVAFLEGPVTANVEAGVKRTWCYAVFGPGGSSEKLYVLDEEDVPVSAALPVPAATDIGDDALLILDISARPVTRLRGALETPGWTPHAPLYGVRPFYRDIVLATLAASELPDRWLGLEAADYVVWDEPDPSAVSIAQLAALREWVQRGGQLVVGLGQSWPAIQRSQLAELLPVVPTGGRVESGGGGTFAVETLEEFFREMVEPSQVQADEERKFRSPLVLATVETRPGGLRAFRVRTPERPGHDLISVHWLGAGRVVALSALLRDLTAVPVNTRFYAQLFDVNPTTKQFREEESKSQFTFASLRSTEFLYPAVTHPISFSMGASLMVLAAFAFVIAYIGIATLASWAWLKRHRLGTLNWTAFAVIAVAASATSLLTVGVFRGVSRGVRSVNCIDVEAANPAAWGKCYFGYSSPTLQRVDLSLPGERGFVRALAVGGPTETTHYSTPQRYQAVAARGVLENTPMRATLKQFEGCWAGVLTGNLLADITVDRATGQVTPQSWVSNGLDVPLAGGFLLYPDPRFAALPVRPAGVTRNWWGREDVPPGLNVLVAWVPPLKPGERATALSATDYERVAVEQQRWLRRANAKREQMRDLPTLWDVQRLWRGGSAPLETEQLDTTAGALLLACTRNFYLHMHNDFKTVSGTPLSTEGLMNLEITHWLAQGVVRGAGPRGEDQLRAQGVLLLLSDAPGPVQMLREGEPLKSAGGRCLYRVRTPIGLVGQPQPPPTPGEEPEL